MKIEAIPQIELGNTRRVRIGDVLNRNIASKSCREFRFAVAYMRLSGLDRLGASLDALVNRRGRISGAIGIDDGITSMDALETLSSISSSSTIFYTVSGFRFHPKVYIMSGERTAVVVAGSANLSCDGLFRNVEFATAMQFDLASKADSAIYEQYNRFVKDLLNPRNANVQPINPSTLRVLSGAVKREADVAEPGPRVRPARAKAPGGGLGDLFPPVKGPVAPPPFRQSIHKKAKVQPRGAAAPPAASASISVFIMQLSSFDSHHRTGVKGTAEMLVPHPAIAFFPALAKSGRKYPDTTFNVVLNTPLGRERHEYRLWYYEERAVGTRIDEYRLRVDHETVDLTTPGGGDLLVVNKLPKGSHPEYEVTIVGRADPAFSQLLQHCRFEAQGKKWGFATE